MTDQFFTPDDDIRIVVSDMDGTLLDGNSELPEEVWEVLDGLSERGIAFVPASGRQHGSLTRLFSRDDLGFIAENGNFVVLGDEELFRAALDRGVAREAIRAFHALQGRNAAMVACAPRMAYVERTSPVFLDEIGKYYANYQVVEDLADVEDDFAKVSVFDLDSAQEVHAHFAHLTDRAEVVTSGPNWVDIQRQDVDKGRGVRVLQDHLGAGPENTVVFGDYHNDLPMFPDAKHTFATANAHPDIKDAAKWVIPSNEDAGVIQVLKSLLETVPPKTD